VCPEHDRSTDGAPRSGGDQHKPSDAGPDIEGAAAAARELQAGLSPGAAGFGALARSAGNRAATRLLQRRPATLTGRFLRVRIIGYSSARWKSARTAEQAAALNLDLSQRRAEAVKEIVLRELSGKVPIPIDVDVSILDADDGEAVTVGGHGEGSREALERTGDRRSNEQRDRRVDIDAELVTTERGSTSVRVRGSALTREWELTVTRFSDLGFGYARADIEVELRNTRSGKVATGRARLEGAGRGGLLPDEGGIGPPRIPLTTDRPVGFKDFDGCFLRLYMASIKLGYGWRRIYMIFGGLRRSPLLIERKAGWGLPGGYGVVGDLSLDNVPDDFMDVDDERPFKRRHGSGESLTSATFATGSAVVRRADIDRIREFAQRWATEFEIH
jgi:hypothetical protein